MTTQRAPAAVLASLAAETAGAAGDWQWLVQGDEDNPYLVYEKRDRSESGFPLICDNAARQAEVSVPLGRAAKRGQPVTIALIAGEQRIALKGLAANDNGVYGHARRVPYRAVVGLLGSAGRVRLAIGARASELAEAGRHERLREFVELCKIK
ncbi:hypothetical protein [Chelatococcus reniformis]|uniref:Uncharacterized protein n=1 Tax=Chelatococcus reniformis TaxID=1494448 RepID=A0A916U627_9HYPH|nr:hypothetical protein [Chelatococcus reniformis]GGC61215.1 hypothetical protein GCM10010994_19710 [Chelatococcus reniformis]